MKDWNYLYAKFESEKTTEHQQYFFIPSIYVLSPIILSSNNFNNLWKSKEEIDLRLMSLHTHRGEKSLSRLRSVDHIFPTMQPHLLQLHVCNACRGDG